jgi:hypothetical protein
MNILLTEWNMKQLDPAYIWSKGNKRKFVVSALDDAIKL